MNEYRVTGELPVHDAKPGDTFEADLSMDEEATLIDQGRVQIVERPYKVVGHRRVHDTDPGGHFDAAFTVAEEAALLGVHIERSPRRSKQTAPDPAKTTTTKE